MPERRTRPSAHRSSRPDRRRSDASGVSQSDGFITTPTVALASIRHASSTNGPGHSYAEPPAPFFQHAFADSPPPTPIAHGPLYMPTNSYQEYREPVNPGASNEGSYDAVDDPAASMVVTPGSPALPRSPPPNEKDKTTEATKNSMAKMTHGKKKRSRRQERPVTPPWETDMGNIYAPRDTILSGYQTPQPNHIPIVDPLGYPAPSPYPYFIDEADLYDREVREDGDWDLCEEY